MSSNIPNTGGGSSQIMKEFQLYADMKSKLDPEFGKQMAMYIYSSFTGAANYFFNRNIRFRKNRQIANGKVDMRQFMDMLDMNGKTNYSNINWSAIKVANTAISRMVGRWMGRNEKVQVQAVDPVSAKAKKRQQEDAEFVFENKEMLAALEQESGVPMVPPDQFVAEDKDELDQWVSEFNRLPEEIKYELLTNNVLQSNGLFDTIKEKLLWDSASVGLVGTHTEMNSQGEIKTTWIRPENIIYSYSEYEDFRDTSWRGHVSVIKISELRGKYGKQFGGNLSEEEIFKIAATSTDWQQLDKLRFLQEWNIAILRPYDEFNVRIMTFEIRSVDSDKYTVTETKGKPNTIIKRGNDGKVKDNQRVLEEKKWNMYKGIYAYDAGVMLEWGLKENMIRPQDPKEIGNVEFSYSFYMYQNYDMRNVAVPEKIEEPIDQMILARLKIQQLVAKMVPAGAAINVDAMQELDLGLANSTTPMEAQRIWEQTGKIYYRGRDAEGRPIPMPIQELANSGFLNQMQGLIQLYQFHYQVLRDELGVDPNLPTQASQPRVAASNINNAIQQADDATDYMYDAYLYVMEETAKKVACLLNKSVTYEAKKYRELMSSDEVKGRDFATKIRMLPSTEEVARLQATVDTAIASNPQFVVYLDPFKITRIAKEDVKLAELYYKQAMKRMIKTEQENATKNSQENAQIQQASMQAKAEGDMQLEGAKNKAKDRNTLLAGAFELLKTGVPVSAELQSILNGVIENVGLPLMMENQQMKQEIMMAQQEQAAQEQGVEKELPQEQMQQEMAA